MKTFSSIGWDMTFACGWIIVAMLSVFRIVVDLVVGKDPVAALLLFAGCCAFAWAHLRNAERSES